jgi:hypothetical protein
VRLKIPEDSCLVCPVFLHFKVVPEEGFEPPTKGL